MVAHGRRIAVGVVLIVGTTAACGLFGSHPSDADLERVFSQRRSAFETLVSMAEEDRRVVRIAPDFTWLEDNAAWPRPDSQLGFPRERWDSYRRLFRELGLEAGMARSGTNARVLFLIASAKGLVTGGSDKGYAFSRAPLPSVDGPLNTMPAGSISGVPSFKHLDGNWYLYFRWDD